MMRNCAMLLILILLPGLAAYAEMSVSTADGNGADTFVGNDDNKGPNSNYGAGGTMDIRNYTNVRAHIGYVRFDISSANGGNLTAAQLQLYITTAQNSRTWNIYGLTDNAADDAWGEMTISYNTAPGMLPAALGTYAMDPAKLTLLGTLYVPSGSNYSLSSTTADLNLDAFLASDTNGLVTLVLIGANDGSGTQFYAAAKEGVAAPVLILPNASTEADTAPPAAPTGLAAIAGNSSVSLNWDDNTEPDLAGYKVYRGTTSGGPYVQIASDVLTSSYVDNTAVNGTTYCYVVTAVDSSSNESAHSGQISVSPASQTLMRYMENLGRGVVAVRTSGGAFVSWRLLGLDPAGIGFNLYRSANGGAAAKINGAVLTGGTCYTDTTANFTQNNAYYVKPVIGGIEQAAGESYTLPANAQVKPDFTVPLQNIGDYYVHLAWVGDLDGDGEYDFVVDRLPNVAGQTPKVEAYLRDGAFLWRVDMGPNSIVDSDGNDGPVAAISNGHNDHVTVHDLDSDGKAEVIIKTANGVVFGNGSTLTHSDNTTQFISVLNGMTGAETARAAVPNPYAADGALAGHFGIGCFDGVHPSFLFKAKNRNADGGFNLVVTTWDFDGSSLSQRWTWARNRFTAPPNFHQIRILDVDGDGKDELADGGYVLDDNGTLLYNLGDQGVVHGDRFHITDLDPARPGLEGYGIQQGNAAGLLEYYYDAATGQLLWQRIKLPTYDVGRGIAADVDPRYPGYEVWAFEGICNPATGTQITQEPSRPWPNFRIWWDGDVLSENLNETKVDKWNYTTSTTSRLLTGYNYDNASESWREAPAFYGDIFGDWREEIVFEASDHTKLVVFTTTVATNVRLYTLAHNPAYRNCMTVKGYMQSHHVDYYLGDGMTTPPAPLIQLAGIKFNPADIVEDGRIDLDDFAVFAVQWMNPPGMPSADIAPTMGDGIVDMLDLQVLADNWLLVKEQ